MIQYIPSIRAGVAEWQTHQTQNLTGATSCGFKSRLRHHCIENSIGILPVEFFGEIISWKAKGIFKYSFLPRADHGIIKKLLSETGARISGRNTCFSIIGA